MIFDDQSAAFISFLLGMALTSASPGVGAVSVVLLRREKWRFTAHCGP